MPNPVPSDPVRDTARARIAADLVGFATGLPPEAILAARNGPLPVSRARHLVMYLLSQAFAMSLAHIAGVVGRDRSTVAHGMRLVEDRRENPVFDAWVGALEEALRAAPEPYAPPAVTPAVAPDLAP